VPPPGNSPGPPAPTATQGVGSLTIGALHVDRDRRVATFRGVALELTAYPFEVLWVLAERAGLVVSRAELHARVRSLRGEPPTEYDPSVDRAIDVHVSKVRQALASVDPDAQRWLKTVRAVGYQLVAEGS